MPTIFTIYFESPFWVGLLEQIEDGQLRAARQVFGAEPSDVEVYAFMQRGYVRLLNELSPPIAVKQQLRKRINPKRQQRSINRQMAAAGASTQSQEALRLQREANKKEKSSRRKALSDAEKESLRAQKVAKRKQKHRGH